MNELPQTSGPRCALPCANFPTCSIQQDGNVNFEISFPTRDWLFQPPGGSPVCLEPKGFFYLEAPLNAGKRSDKSSLTATSSLPANTIHFARRGCPASSQAICLVCLPQHSCPICPPVCKAFNPLYQKILVNLNELKVFENKSMLRPPGLTQGQNILLTPKHTHFELQDVG